MLPDSKIAPDSVHDVLVENLAASPTWRSQHISPGDVTSLRQRWPKAVFRTMRQRSKEVELLRRFARRRPEWAFRHNGPGFCSICQEQIVSALDVHMINVHLELEQLWQCPVEWCAVWKGSVSDCLGHLQDKHGGSQYVALKNIAKFFPPWTVPRDLWMTALHPDVSGIAVDGRVPVGTQVPCVQGPISPAGAPGGGGSTSSAVVIRGSSYDHRAAHTSAHFHSCVGGGPWAGAGAVFSARHAFTGTDRPPSRIVRQ